MKVCFIGNSYTATHDLPGVIGELAVAAGCAPFEPTLCCAGGKTLARHQADGAAEALIRRGGWDWVVLQEQSQVPAFPPALCEARMYPAVRAFDTAARAVGARTLLFETWAHRDGDRHNLPGDSYTAMQARLEAGYAAIAQELQLPVAKVGAAWRLALERRPDAGLWEADGSHPSLSGTRLAATILFAALYDRPDGYIMG